MNFELIQTQYFDETAHRLPAYRVGRVNYGNGRSYVKILPDGQLEEPFRLFVSLTTAISQCAPMEQPLLEWYCKHGYEEANRLSRIAADYGTLMHLEIGKYLINGYYDFQEVEQVISDYGKSVQPDWKYKLRYDVAAFITFAQSVNLTPLAVEQVLVSERGFGTLIDLVCEMDWQSEGHYGEVYKSGDRKGELKLTKRTARKIAIVNFKSGRHGFYRSHGIQCECERQLFEENYPDIKLDLSLNWSPKEWQTMPSWNLRDWTGEIEQDEIDAILTLAKLRYGTRAMNKKYINLPDMAFKQRPITEEITLMSVEEYSKMVYSQYL